MPFPERRSRDRQQSDALWDRFDRRLLKLENDFQEFTRVSEDHHREVMKATNRRNDQFDSALKVFGEHIKECKKQKWITVAGWALAVLLIAFVALKVFSL